MPYSLKSFLTAGLGISPLLVSGSVLAATGQSNWYVGASGDLTWLSHSDTGGGGNLELGYRFWPSDFGDFRLEGEAGYHGAPGSGSYSNTHYLSYMGNLYYDFNTLFPSANEGWRVVPYVGGGLGDAAVHYGHATLSDTFNHHENDFAYEGMVGVTLVSSAMPNTDWSLGYRYLGTDGRNLDSNNLELGVRFHF